jgi:hypothetical protein
VAVQLLDPDTGIEAVFVRPEQTPPQPAKIESGLAVAVIVGADCAVKEQELPAVLQVPLDQVILPSPRPPRATENVKTCGAGGVMFKRIDPLAPLYPST